MLETLTTSQLLLAAIILMLAYTLRGITGFGSGLVAIPLLALMLPITVVVPMVGILDYSASLSHGYKLRKDINWRLIFSLLPFTLTGVLIALYLFNTLDATVLKKILGGFIILYALYSLLSQQLPVHKNRLWAVPGGLLGGLIGTLFGTGGPFYVIFLQLQGLSKTAFRATIATILLLDGSSRIIAYSFNGFYHADTLLLIIAAVPIMIIAMYIGGHIHTTISHQTIQKAIGVLLIVSGNALIWS